MKRIAGETPPKQEVVSILTGVVYRRPMTFLLVFLFSTGVIKILDTLSIIHLDVDLYPFLYALLLSIFSAIFPIFFGTVFLRVLDVPLVLVVAIPIWTICLALSIPLIIMGIVAYALYLIVYFGIILGPAYVLFEWKNPFGMLVDQFGPYSTVVGIVCILFLLAILVKQYFWEIWASVEKSYNLTKRVFSWVSNRTDIVWEKGNSIVKACYHVCPGRKASLFLGKALKEEEVCEEKTA